MKPRLLKNAWSDQANWLPFDPAPWVFLGRAVERLGRARYGDDWSGLEFLTDSQFYPHPFLDVTLTPSDVVLRRSMNRAVAHYLLTEAGHELPPASTALTNSMRIAPSAVSSGLPGSRGPHIERKSVATEWEPSPEQWAEARRLRDIKQEAWAPGVRAALSRRDDIFARLIPPSLSGELLTGFRSLGGDVYALQPRVWNVERATSLARLYALRIDWQNPIGPMTANPVSKTLSWLYVDSAGLASLEQAAAAERLHAATPQEPWAAHGLSVAPWIAKAEVQSYLLTLWRDNPRRSIAPFAVYDELAWRVWGETGGHGIKQSHMASELRGRTTGARAYPAEVEKAGEAKKAGTRAGK